MTTFSYNPTYGSAVDTTPRVRTAQFGDGYAQRVGDGINTVKRIWNLRFQLETSVMDAIEAFLIARAGTESFDWTPVSGSAGKWICPSWNRSADAGFDVISTSFTEVFGD